MNNVYDEDGLQIDPNTLSETEPELTYRHVYTYGAISLNTAVKEFGGKQKMLRAEEHIHETSEIGIYFQGSHGSIVYLKFIDYADDQKNPIVTVCARAGHYLDFNV